MSEWGFIDEKRFVDNLGRHRGQRQVDAQEYLEMLRQYLRNLDLRYDNPPWLDQIRKYVERRIKVEEKCLLHLT